LFKLVFAVATDDVRRFHEDFFGISSGAATVTVDVTFAIVSLLIFGFSERIFWGV
jgi:hypothetical protein